jgi:hypothetical protein
MILCSTGGLLLPLAAGIVRCPCRLHHQLLLLLFLLQLLHTMPSVLLLLLLLLLQLSMSCCFRAV